MACWQRQIIPKKGNVPQSFIDPFAAKDPALKQLWKGPQSIDQLTNAFQQTPQWNPQWGPVPRVGYLTPEEKKSGGFLKSLGGGIIGGGIGSLLGAPFGPLGVLAGDVIGSGIGIGKNLPSTSGGGPVGPGQLPADQPYSPYYFNQKYGTPLPNIPSFAHGGAIPGQNTGFEQQNLVGEAGPELHIGESGRQNLVGEQGPELFNPNESGQIIPYDQLSPQLQTGQGPQANTGQETPLPGAGGTASTPQGDQWQGGQPVLNSIANALMQPAMSMAGYGMQEGGFLEDDKVVDPFVGGNRTIPLTTEEYNPDLGGPTVGGGGRGGGGTTPTLNEVYNQGTTATGGTQQATGSTFRPHGFAERAARAADGTVAPLVPPTDDVLVDDTPIVDPTTLDTIPRTPWNIDPNTGTPFQTLSVKEILEGTNPELAKWYNSAFSAQPSYTFNPDQVNQEFREQVFQPGMQQWQEDVVPWLREQFVATGNVFGGEMPQYITRRAESMARSYDAERFRMLQSGREREFQALEGLANRQTQAAAMMADMSMLPIEMGIGQQQIFRMQDELQANRIFTDINIEGAFANINIQKASFAKMMNELSSFGYEQDAKAIDNMIKFAELDSMGPSRLRQELDNISVNLDNYAKLYNIAALEQMTIQDILNITYNDWKAAVGDQIKNPGEAMKDILGFSVTENIVFEPTTGQINFSGIGQAIAGTT